jgi:hypothetical protein
LITTGTCLTNGTASEIRYSCNGCFNLAFQSDGNLVVSHNKGSKGIIWQSHTYGAVKTCVNWDGHFVIYGPNDVPVWTSGWYTTDGSNPWADVMLQNDGNLVVLTGLNTPSINARWASGKTACCDGTQY